MDAGCARALMVAGLACLVSACASEQISIGVGLPIGRHMGVGVSVGADGSVSTRVGVHGRLGQASVGASLPVPVDVHSVPAPDDDADRPDQGPE